MLPVRRLLKRVLLLLLGSAALLAATYLVFLKMVDLDTYKEQILAQLQDSLKRPVSYATGRLSFSYGPAFSFDRLEISEPDGSEKFISVERFTCRVDILPLLKKQIAIHGLVAEKPLIRLERRADGKYNFSDLIEAKAGGNKIGDIKIRSGHITVIDRAVQQEPLVTELQKVDLSLDHLGRGKRSHIKLSAALGNGAGGSVMLNGKLKLSPESQPLEDSTLDAALSAKGLDAGHFWPYYGSKMPFKKLFASFNTDSEIKGKLSDFKASGKMSATAVRFDYQPIFKAPLTPKNVKVKYNLEVNKRDVNISAVEVNIDGAEIKGSCAIKDYRSSDPRITAQALSNEMNFSRFHQYIPYGIIVKHVAEWIEKHIQGGVYKLLDGRLDGRVSQILHMEKEQNYNILFINARVEKGIVSYGSSVPTFNNIQGGLELKGKDFSLHGMSGNFGTAPLTLEGKITDYPLDSPSAYPFKMVISPGRQEIGWLLGKETASRFSYSGSSSLHLTGDGFFTGYKLAGDWNLTPAAYSYADLIAKPVGTASAISFRSTLTPAEATLNSARCSLAALSLELSGRYPFASAKGLDITINSNSFLAEAVSTMSQLFGKYQPSGRVQLSVRGTQPDRSNKDFHWKGSVALSNAAVRYSPTAQPVTAITGNISFDENSMESSQLSARVGKTSLNGKLAVSSLSPLAFNTSFTAPSVELADFGFRTAMPQPRLTKVKAEISSNESAVVIKNLSGNLNRSQLSVRGQISDLKNFKADLSIAATYLDISDLILFSSIERTSSPAATNSSPPHLKATIKADSGVFNGTEFTNLSAFATLANRIFQIHSLDTEVLGGKLAAKGKIISQSSPTQYQGEFKLTEASASEVIHLFAVGKQEMTGKFSCNADITAKGENSAELKQSAVGGIKFHASKGMLRQFSGLSKVFSILNISQLFKLKLPDMVSEGMPYTDIKGTMAIKDGFASTNDLFIASNAMNISIVGKHDFINDNLDFTVGIQPLQTVDKVISHIPIVGWILTGKEKAFITTYFEIKGKSTAPKVSAIPVSSIGKGVLGIFKRVFQLPAKLITDTGEVILGN